MNSRTRYLNPAVLCVAAWLFGFCAMPVFGQTKIQQRDAVVEGRHLQIASYYVPPYFMRPQRERGASDDPFVYDSKEFAADAWLDAKPELERVGLSFGRGCSARFFPKESYLVICNTEEQIEWTEAYLGIGGCGGGERTVTIIVEQIAVERSELSEWLRANHLGSDGTGLRRELQKSIRSERAKLLETVVLAARSGHRAKIESVLEYIYPSELDGEHPNFPIGAMPVDSDGNTVFPQVPFVFETRNVGITFECDPILGADWTTIDLNLAVENVELEGRESWPSEEVPTENRVQQPTFFTARVVTQLTLTDGRYALVDVINARDNENGDFENAVVVTFVRVDVSRPAEHAGEEGQ